MAKLGEDVLEWQTDQLVQWLQQASKHFLELCAQIFRLKLDPNLINSPSNFTLIIRELVEVIAVIIVVYCYGIKSH